MMQIPGSKKAGRSKPPLLPPLFVSLITVLNFSNDNHGIAEKNVLILNSSELIRSL
jgi:hypothetical protein